MEKLNEKEQLKKEFIRVVEDYLYEHLYYDAYGIVNGYCSNADVINNLKKELERKLLNNEN